MRSPLYLVSRTVRGEVRHLVSHPWDGFGGPFTWANTSPTFWLTKERLDALKQDPWWHGEDLRIEPVSDGPWLGYWRPRDHEFSLYLSQRTVEWNYSVPAVGPYTLILTSEDDPEAWWAWQTPRDTRPTICFRRKASTGVAVGDLRTCALLAERGRGRLLPVRPSLCDTAHSIASRCTTEPGREGTEPR